MDWIQSLLFGLAILLPFQNDNLVGSNSLVLAMLVLSLLGSSGGRPWSVMLAGLLLLNVRGVVLDEGPMPVSPVDYIVMLAAFLCGYRRSQAWWLRQAAVVAIATLIGVLLHFEVVMDFARFGVEYSIAGLTKNQTALLAGLACLSSLIAFLAYRNLALRVLHGFAFAASVLLLRAADSRAGAGMAILSILLAGLVVLVGPLLRLGRKRWNLQGKTILITALLLLGLGAGLWWINQQANPGVTGGIDQFYGEENLENDAARLNLWRCYFGLPFTGDNRFIWGVGYEKAWRFWCSAERVGRPLSHAHNFILQVWGENGIAGSGFILGWLGWICTRAAWNIRRLSVGWDRLMVFASTAMLIYLVGFNMFELGLIKVPLLTYCFGLFLASPFFGRPVSQHVDM